MRRLFIIALVLACAGAAFGFTVSDNPIGASRPLQVDRAVKGNPIAFVLSTIGDSVAIHTALDTTSGAWRFVWVAPYRCRVDSFKLINGTAIAAADTASTKQWWVKGISNNSGTNLDTLWADSTNTAPLAARTITQYSVWTIKGGPDSTLNQLEKGKILRITLGQIGLPATAMKWYGEFFVVPADKE